MLDAIKNNDEDTVRRSISQDMSLAVSIDTITHITSSSLPQDLQCTLLLLLLNSLSTNILSINITHNITHNIPHIKLDDSAKHVMNSISEESVSMKYDTTRNILATLCEVLLEDDDENIRCMAGLVVNKVYCVLRGDEFMSAPGKCTYNAVRWLQYHSPYGHKVNHKYNIMEDTDGTYIRKTYAADLDLSMHGFNDSLSYLESMLRDGLPRECSSMITHINLRGLYFSTGDIYNYTNGTHDGIRMLLGLFRRHVPGTRTVEMWEFIYTR